MKHPDETEVDSTWQKPKFSRVLCPGDLVRVNRFSDKFIHVWPKPTGVELPVGQFYTNDLGIVIQDWWHDLKQGDSVYDRSQDQVQIITSSGLMGWVRKLLIDKVDV